MTTTTTFTFRTRATLNTQGELWAVTVDHSGGTASELDRMRQALAESWHGTKTTLTISDLSKRNAELLIEELEHWGDPDAGFSSEFSFRIRPFQRMARELRELIS